MNNRPDNPSERANPQVDLGPYNRVERLALGDIVGADKVGGDKVLGDKYIQIFIYTGPDRPPDDTARSALEQAYRSEIITRYILWEARYVPLPIKADGRAQAAGFVGEREELFLEALRDAAVAEHTTPERHTFTDLREGLKRYNDLLLLGPPGGGKTTALWRLALDLAEDGLLHGDDAAPLPVFVRLGALDKQQTPFELLQTEMASAAREDASGRRFALDAHRLLAPLLPELLEQGRLVLLWDGLNETPRALFAAAARMLEEFRKEYPGRFGGPYNRSVTTCRTDDHAQLLEQVKPDPFPVQRVAVQGLDAESMRLMVQRRLGADRGQSLLDALQQPQHRALAGLARTPLLLTMICEVYAAAESLPTNRGRLLQDFVAQRWRWEAQRQGDAWIPATTQGRVLARLAYAMTESRGRGTSVAWEWAERELRTAAPDVEPTHLRRLARRADLVEMIGEERALRFSHQLIQEYFAALELRARIAAIVAQRGEIAPDDLRAYAAPGKRTGWEETLLLLAGIEGDQGDAHRLIRAFLSQPLQAARLLQAGGEDLDPALLNEVGDEFAVMMADERVPALQRIEAGQALGEIGDPRPGVCDLPPPMVEFPGGSFVIGEPRGKHRFDNEINDQPLTIAPFALARYPVTNAQYKLFVDNGGYDPDAPWWRTDPDAQTWLRNNGRTQPRYWDNARFARPNHPVVGVTWYEATAFCRWLTQQVNNGIVYRLPSEAEWEYAARGAVRRTYPWGAAEPDGERCNFNWIYGGPTAVGCFPSGATPEGLLDMAGNVWEWTRSEFRSYPYDPTDGRENATETGRKRFTLRGGSWGYYRDSARCACRRAGYPDVGSDLYGFRLAHLFSLPS